MKNLMTNNIKHLEEELTPLFARIRGFKSTPKNKVAKKGLNLIVKRIKELPKYTEEELKVFVKELNKLPKNSEKELITLVENLKTAPKKSNSQIRDDVYALKYQPKRTNKEREVFQQKLICFPQQTDKELSAVLEYIKISKKEMEKEINIAIRDTQRLPFHIDENADSFYKYLESKGISEQTQNGLVSFIKRISLIRYLNVIESIKHFEKEAQEQLIALTDIIRRHIPNCSMIVLFGSYARGTEVVFDLTIKENGSRESYQSDFNIMIVMPKPATVTNANTLERRICSDIKAEYDELFFGKLHAPPQFIVECEKSLCSNLKRQQPFFSDIIKEGIFLYNDERISLPEPKELSYKIKKEIAQEYFDHLYYPDGFLNVGNTLDKEANYVLASFMIHQACENYYRDMSMVFINYNPKEHNLEKLIEKTADFSPELSTAFPRATKFEDKTFKLLRDAYIGARYDTKFVVKKKELKYMIERAEVLKEITYRICKDRIEYYDILAKKE